jgi:hypothetical protein
VYLQFQPVRAKSLTRHLCGKNSFFGIAHAGGIGQKLNAGMLYMHQHIIFLIVQFNSFHCHRHHFRAGCQDGLFHHFVGMELSGS